jgi:chorismate synthase
MNWGTNIRLTVFGESHGPAIGAVLDGLPAGEELDPAQITAQMARRAPGQDPTATQRKESDSPRVLSGLLDGKTTGAPLCAVIDNTSQHSQDYDNLLCVPRPGHADYTAFLRYQGFNDVRGGGHFSGRLTAPLVFAGSVCRQILRRRGIRIGAHVLSIHGVSDLPFDPVSIPDSLLKDLSSRYFPTLSKEAQVAMRAEIEKARMNLDSVGGVVECAVTGVPGGYGGPLTEGVESSLSSLLFGIPACKGVEFGAGFAASELYGSENNDPLFLDGEGEIRTKTNRAGGILGGITNGMPIVFRTAFKPTPSIGKEQESVDLLTRTDAKLTVKGRHDPCIVPRAVPVVEAAAAIALLDLLA